MAIKGYLYVLSPNHSKNEQAVAILPTDYHYHSAVRGVPGPISRGSKHVAPKSRIAILALALEPSGLKDHGPWLV